jgi:ZIP family zinc transporter
MLTSIVHVMLVALVPVSTTMLGAVAAAVRAPGPRVRSAIQHFAAGIVFSVVAVELLPDVVRWHAIGAVTGGFALGIGVMLLLRHITEVGEVPPGADGERERSATGMLVAIGVDVLLDGLLLGIAFAAGNKEGVMVAIALSIELLSLGLATTITLRARGWSAPRSIVTVTGLSLPLVAGAVIGDTILHNAPTIVLSAVLSFGCAALLFLVTEELLVEAHEVPETPWTTAMFFAGFLLFVVFGMLA